MTSRGVYAGAGVEPGCSLGIRPVKKREMTPITARIESDVRRPAICESSYEARTLTWATAGTPALSNSACASLFEMKGAPAASYVLA